MQSTFTHVTLVSSRYPEIAFVNLEMPQNLLKLEKTRRQKDDRKELSSRLKKEMTPEPNESCPLGRPAVPCCHEDVITFTKKLSENFKVI